MLVTPMMEDVREIVLSEVDSMEMSVGFAGNSRAGKTKALEHVMAWIREVRPTVQHIHVIMTDSAMHSEKRFLRLFLTAMTDDETDAIDPEILRPQIVRRFVARCSEAQDSRVVLYIDEAQRITPEAWIWLMDLTNYLEKYSLNPTIVYFASPAVVDVKEKLQQKDKRELLGRFFGSLFIFGSVTEKDTLKKILVQYDDYLVAAFPRDSQTCITAAYVPSLYRSGGRIGNATDALWAAVIKTAGAHGYAPIIGMKSLTRAVEQGLKKLATEPKCENLYDVDWWLKVLQRSGYLSHLEISSDQQSKTK
jgi:hypothetical protein